MPSEFSSSHSVEDAVQLSKNLANEYDIIPIKNIYETFLADLKPIFKDLPFKFNLIYRASREGFWIDKFHTICDNKEPTIVVIKLIKVHNYSQ